MHLIVCPLRPSAGIVLQPAGANSVDDKLTRECLKFYFTEEQSAINYAEEMAKKNPTVQFVVLSPLAVVETLTPQIVRKKVTDNGELVVDKGATE